MNTDELKNKLIESLGKIYYMEVFSQLTEFLQGELYVLHFLSRNTGKEINPSFLSERLHMTRPRITATLLALKNKGYVETLFSEEDGRRKIVMLTKEGLEFIMNKQTKVENNFDFLVEGLGEKDSRELVRLIDLIVNLMNTKKDKGKKE